MTTEEATDRTISFKQAHPFRVPLDKDQHVRFTSLDLAAESAVYHKSCVIDERTDNTYNNQSCRGIYNARIR